MRLPCLGRVKGENLFDDQLSWEMEHQQEQDHKNKGILEDNNSIFHLYTQKWHYLIVPILDENII